jgi:hypothetical protein
MVVGNTNVTVEHLKVQLVCLAWFGVWHLMTLKVTNLENINCTGLFYSIEISYLFIQLRTISIQKNLNSSDRHWLL